MTYYIPFEFEPLPLGRQKEFYGKCSIKQWDNGLKILRSYKTDVAAILPNGDFIRLWGGYSATTLRHVDAFIGRSIGKKEWDAMEVKSIDEELRRIGFVPVTNYLKMVYQIKDKDHIIIDHGGRLEIKEIPVHA